MSIVSNNIKYLRKSNGFTQEQLAQKIGIKRSLLGAYEESRANPNLINLTNMATVFGTTVDHLLKHDLRNTSETAEISLAINFPKNQQAKEVKSLPQALNTSSPTKTKTPTQSPISEQKKYTVPAKLKNTTDSEKAAEPFSKLDNTIESPVLKQPYKHLNDALPTIQWVSRQLVPEYVLQYQNPLFLTHLPTFQLPNLPKGYFRAFEIGDDFAFPGSILVGTFVRNWYDIQDGNQYIFVLLEQGVIFRTAHSQDMAKGMLNLKSDLHTIADQTVSLSEILEVWEVKAFVSVQLPKPVPSVDRVATLVHELQQEVNKLS